MDERKLKVIEKTEAANEQVTEKVEKPSKTVRHSNPISKRLLEFHHEKIGKFSVKDLFKP